jgi:fimbrial chaperone protein
MAHPHVLTRAWALLALLLSSPVEALEVSPLRVTLAPGQSDGELWLYNEAARPWSGQARLYHWEQTQAAEVLVPAQDVALSPATLTLPAHARQRLRVVRLGPPPATEQGYRLVIRAGPDSPPLQVSLPVFIAGPEPAAAPALTVQVHAEADTATLELYNAGRSHARLADLVFIDAQGRERPILPDLAGYVLAQRSRHWPLPGPAAAYAGGHFSARLGDAARQPLAGPTPPIAPADLPGL